MSRPNIKEIARLAGVSPSAVSIVVNNKKGVSDATRKRVQGIIDQLQYIPNQNSRRLLFRKTDNIAILLDKSISPLSHAFYNELNNSIFDQCESNGYNVVFTACKWVDNRPALPNVIRSHDVDGIIIYSDIADVLYDEIAQLGIPYIGIDNHQASERHLSVRTDYCNAAYIATEYLLRIGHRDIAFIGNSQLTHFNAQTLEGFRRAMADYSAPVREQWLHYAAHDEAGTFQCIDAILQHGIPTAISCAADIYALYAVKRMRMHGIHIPDQVSVVGIDDIPLSSYADPALTTVRIAKEEMCSTAVELLLQRIQGKAVQSRLINNSSLVLRESTRPR